MRNEKWLFAGVLCLSIFALIVSIWALVRCI